MSVWFYNPIAFFLFIYRWKSRMWWWWWQSVFCPSSKSKNTMEGMWEVPQLSRIPSLAFAGTFTIPKAFCNGLHRLLASPVDVWCNISQEANKLHFLSGQVFLMSYSQFFFFLGAHFSWYKSLPAKWNVLNFLLGFLMMFSISERVLCENTANRNICYLFFICSAAI